MVTTNDTLRHRPTRLVRFDLTQRLSHWSVATLFALVMVTALPLYFGTLFGLVLPRPLVNNVHLWSGLLLPIPIVVSLVGSWGKSMRRDIRTVSQWRREELTWLRSRGRVRIQMDKFNPGQKLNSLFTGAAIVITFITGVILKWFRFFPVGERTNATFVHDLVAFGLFVVITGHVVMALTHRDALWSMVRGWVSRSWAERQTPLWLRETDDEKSRPNRTNRT